jgi:hypothetical protein
VYVWKLGSVGRCEVGQAAWGLGGVVCVSLCFFEEAGVGAGRYEKGWE